MAKLKKKKTLIVFTTKMTDFYSISQCRASRDARFKRRLPRFLSTKLSLL